MTGRIVRSMFRMLTAAVILSMGVPSALVAQGHGPIYGLSTPTLGKGGWSLDVGAMARLLDGPRTAMVRPMVSYGITADLQAFGSFPVAIERDSDAPPVRGFTRMPATRDVEIGFGWRPQRTGVGVGARRETTIWVAVDHPLESDRRGLETAPGAFGAVVTGYASRTVYAWAGGAYRRYATDGGDRPGDVTMASFVLGYRPSVFRGDYPNADWRAFVEVVGEWVGEDRLSGRAVSDTGGRQIFVALTALGLYGSWGMAAGPALPVSQNLDGPREKARFAVNVTFWW